MIQTIKEVRKYFKLNDKNIIKSYGATKIVFGHKFMFQI